MTRASLARNAKLIVLALFAMPKYLRVIGRVLRGDARGQWLSDAPDWFVAYVVMAGDSDDKTLSVIFQQASTEREFRRRTGVSK